MLRRQLVTGLLVTICLIVLLGVIFPVAVWGVGQVAFRHQANGSLVKVKGNTVGSALIGQNFVDKSGNPLPRYFQPRPSAAGSGYDPTASGGSNLGPTNPKLVGFIPGVNTVGLDGNPSATNPFATPGDPYCVPVDDKGNPVTSPSDGQTYQKNPDGTYACYASTVPERAIAYRALNGLAAGAPVPVDAVTASGSGLDPDITEANALDQAARVARVRKLSEAAVVDLVHRHTTSRAWGILGEKTVNVLDINLALDQITPSG
jgi:potassium-transporting ATPase KdpC subunit